MFSAAPEPSADREPATVGGERDRVEFPVPRGVDLRDRAVATHANHRVVGRAAGAVRVHERSGPRPDEQREPAVDRHLHAFEHRRRGAGNREASEVEGRHQGHAIAAYVQQVPVGQVPRLGHVVEQQLLLPRTQIQHVNAHGHTAGRAILEQHSACTRAGGPACPLPPPASVAWPLLRATVLGTPGGTHPSQLLRDSAARTRACRRRARRRRRSRRRPSPPASRSPHPRPGPS